MAIDLSLVIACYNEEAILEKNVEEIIKVLDTTNFNYEIIFVDDNSQDNTCKIIDFIINKYKKKFKKIFHKKNEGRGKSVTDGFLFAEGMVAGFIDIDLEVHARYIPAFVLAIKEGYDAAIAQRVYTFQIKNTHRYLMSKGYNWLVRHFLHLPFYDTEAGYKFFNTQKVLPIIKKIKNYHWFWDTEFMARIYFAGLKIKIIPCVYIKNFEKRTTVKIFYDSFYYFKKLWTFRRDYIKY